jgi:DNA-binding XRE family transcriptional regulator
MLEHTKKRHTDTVALQLIGPAANRRKALASLRALGFVAVDEDSSISVEELFPTVTGDKKPGAILAGARGKEGLTQKQLAEKSGIAQGHISEMEQGRRPIGIKTAKTLGAALNIGYKVFL